MRGLKCRDIFGTILGQLGHKMAPWGAHGCVVYSYRITHLRAAGCRKKMQTSPFTAVTGVRIPLGTPIKTST